MIRTKLGRVLTGSCTRAQASAFLTRRKVALNEMLDRLTTAQKRRYEALDSLERMKFETAHGVPARDGNCTFQSAEYVLRFGGDTFAITKRARAKAEPSKRAVRKALLKPSDNANAVAPWWMRFGFDD